MAQKGWIKKENIKWMLLFFLLAFILRASLSTIYEPVDHWRTDQYQYLRMNQELLEGIIEKDTKLGTFILTPIMILFNLLGVSQLTGTILAGCLISALTIIPIWMIAEHLNINPKAVSFFFLFSSLDLFKIISIGSYNMSFGLLFFTTYILFLLKKQYFYAPFILAIPFFTHKTSPAFFVFFLATVGLLSIAKYKKIFNIEAKQWILWSCAIITLFLIIKTGILNQEIETNQNEIYAINKYHLPVEGEYVRIPLFNDYLSIVGPHMFLLALFGLIHFYRAHKKNLLIQSWTYLPAIFTFIPFFIDTNVSVRMAVFGAGSMAILATYSFTNFKEKHWIIKVLIICLIILTVYYTLNMSLFSFYHNSEGVAVLL